MINEATKAIRQQADIIEFVLVFAVSFIAALFLLLVIHP